MFSASFLLAVFEAFVILSTIVLPIKSPVAYAAFWITLFEEAFNASAVDFFNTIKTFLTVLIA